MQSFDYKDESKDVKGKVRTKKILILLSVIDRSPVSHQRAPADSPRLEERCESDYSKLGRCYSDDREKHLQTTTKC